ncbi:MAG: glycosyltransferase [Bacteroidetes bacterium]|nr:glycosyltransferase [Bacteroidota bacterium]
MSRDIIRHIIDLDQYEVKLVSMPWGACPMNALKETDPKDTPLIVRTINDSVDREIDLYIQISVPNEFQRAGKYNIGITAGIETTLVAPEWIKGANNMDLILTTSEHSKRVFENTKVEHRNTAGQVISSMKLDTPIEVLHNCVDTNIFKYIGSKDISPPIEELFSQIDEKFCYLFVGLWGRGDFREDRKNIGLPVHLFCETFKQTDKAKQPALILKTSGANFSIMDRKETIAKIEKIRALTKNAPNVYVIHGELTEQEMNELYNHPKVKAHVSFTKGEGFGRPLLEATQSNKPIVASGWSGHLDFLNKDDAILVGGKLDKVEKGAVWKGVIVPESQWFNVDEQMGCQALMYVFKHYHSTLNGAYKLAKNARTKFSYEVIGERTKELISKYVPKFQVAVPLKLPMLKNTNG